MDASNWVSSVANVVIAIGVIFVLWQAHLLRQQIEADHDRSRKELAVSLIGEWTRSIKPELSSADKLVRQWDCEQSRNMVNILPVKITPKQKHLAEACLNRELKNANIGQDGRIELDETEVAEIRY
jgi:hypothetical protein